MNFKQILWTIIAYISISILKSTPVLTYKLYTTDHVRISSGKGDFNNQYKNFEFLYYHNDSRQNIVFNGIGTFMNISYSNLFLRITIDQSIFYLVSERCTNCGKNILINSSRAVEGGMYTYNNDECWSGSISESIPSTNAIGYTPYCDVQIEYDEIKFRGFLAFQSLYIDILSKVVALGNIVYVINQDNNIIDDNLNGVLGLGNSDNDAAFGTSYMEEVLAANLMEYAYFSICIDNIGEGNLIFNGVANSTEHFNFSKLIWFDQLYPFFYMISARSISFGDWHYYSNKLIPVEISYTTPYLLLPDYLYDVFMTHFVKLICGSENSKIKELCNFANNFEKENHFIIINASTLNELRKLPPITFYFEGTEGDHKIVNLIKYISICPEYNFKYDYFTFGTIDDSKLLEICLLVKRNTRNFNKMQRIVMGNIIQQSSGNLFIFDKRRGLVGYTDEIECFNLNLQNIKRIQPSNLYNIIAQIIVAIGFIWLIMLARSKCEEYFFEPDDDELDVNLLNLLNSTSQITQTNYDQILNNREEVLPSEEINDQNKLNDAVCDVNKKDNESFAQPFKNK